ncbi:hypothetical protein CMUS01_10423 [Colletotrichum musicola]|uniref:Uncharacterized protein n=1 Tax=Colletotrichum musicola TaxID=2175873 RepID=A0A8H6K2S0_9PEZI|nr:hypothetical protein CMUS01_10423 [Colletotrichum musicola]
MVLPGPPIADSASNPAAHPATAQQQSPFPANPGRSPWCITLAHVSRRSSTWDRGRSISMTAEPTGCA